ncbi:hypothetical protein C8N46_101770 [Kordia periserrulae]|uniref:Uncharacterized protein n=1 Tax=Kordia periserrulae TaxID=701523 RepID=A0A2T6C753_9FLAO|nr:hypothetical protein [Kordia periserrulae]PTX64159.1 hypothetical protein C8N46_101770 [Kordia periserrulae]
MKKFSYIAIVIAILLSIYSATKLDFDNLLKGDSMVAVISIVAALCAILIVLIYLTSKKIQDKINDSKK